MGQPLNPSLYQINTRVWLAELGQARKQPATLDDIPDAALDDLARRGFDWVWFLGVWQTGKAGRAIAAAHWQADYRDNLPDVTEEDVSGSPFAVQKYALHADFGGPRSLPRLRQRLNQRGLKLLLDFVPNHTALDHTWASRRPEFYIHGRDQDLARQPQNYRQMRKHKGSLILAYGRDPYFPGWTDTLQLNYRHAGLRRAMIRELTRIAGRCDGVRCDMAMLLLPEVIARTWGDASRPSDGSEPVDTPFWPEAIDRVHKSHPDFVFLAEVYWGLEAVLQEQGFDYTYDKRLYDHLLARDAAAVRGDLQAGVEFQSRLVRFLENHDEPRAATAFPGRVHPAAAVLTYLAPGLRFFHEGQFEGRRVKTAIQLGRRVQEPVDRDLQSFYQRLLACLERREARQGRWQLLDCRPAWEGNPTWERFLAFVWEETEQQRLLVAVNFGPTQGQCYVPLPWLGLAGQNWLLRDLMSPARYEREGDGLATAGLYLDMPEWGYHVFAMTPQ